MNPASCALCDDFTIRPNFEGDASRELNNHVRYQHASQVSHWYPLVVAAVRLGLDGTTQPQPQDLGNQKLHDISDLVDEWALTAQSQPPTVKARMLSWVTPLRRILGRTKIR